MVEGRVSLVAVYLASPRIEGWMKWTRLDCLCASVALLKKFAPPMPIIVFHEDYTDEDKVRLLTIQPDTKFELVDFSTHLKHFVSNRPGVRTGTYGYYMMCRFFSGVMQAHPALSGYTHYLRLDDDSYIVAPISDTTMGRLQSHDYTFNGYSQEPHIPLWGYTLSFLAAENLHAPPVNYSENVPYTNFHVSSLALWKHPVIKRYTDGIEKQHGCVKLGWYDASIHSQIAFMLCPALGLSVNIEKEFHYRHNIQCCHGGIPHNQYCHDGLGNQYSWGPPPL